MTQSPDHPELPFVESTGYTKGRALGPPLWIVVHDMEEEETPTKAEAVATYFATGAGGRSVSSHYCADSTGVVQCVRLADTAWTVGNTPGNYRGINWELAGFASQSRAQWLDDFGRAMLSCVAPIMRADAQRYGIPLRTLTDDEVRAYKPGITSHWQLGRVFGGTDHTDPGPNFPWDYLLNLLGNAPESTVEDDMAWLIHEAVEEGGDGSFWLAAGRVFGGKLVVAGIADMTTVEHWQRLGARTAVGGPVDRGRLKIVPLDQLTTDSPAAPTGPGSAPDEALVGTFDYKALAGALLDEVAARRA